MFPLKRSLTEKSPSPPSIRSRTGSPASMSHQSLGPSRNKRVEPKCQTPPRLSSPERDRDFHFPNFSNYAISSDVPDLEFAETTENSSDSFLSTEQSQLKGTGSQYLTIAASIKPEINHSFYGGYQEPFSTGLSMSRKDQLPIAGLLPEAVFSSGPSLQKDHPIIEPNVRSNEEASKPILPLDEIKNDGFTHYTQLKGATLNSSFIEDQVDYDEPIAVKIDVPEHTPIERYSICPSNTSQGNDETSKTTKPAVLAPRSSVQSISSSLSESGASDTVSDITGYITDRSNGACSTWKSNMNTRVEDTVRMFGYHLIKCVIPEVLAFLEKAGVNSCTQGFSSSASTNGESHRTAQTEQTYPSSTKRRRGNNNSKYSVDEGNNESDDDDHQGWQQNADLLSSKSEERFACPFYQNDPMKHQQWKSCWEHGFETVHRVKEHVYRRHPKPIHCPRCGIHFKTDEAQSNHLTQRVICELLQGTQVDGMTKKQEKLLKSRKRPHGQTEADRWREVYRILFFSEGNDETPSPYWQPDQSEAHKISHRCSDYFQENLPKRIIQDIQYIFTPIAAWLRPSIEAEVKKIVQKRTDEVAKMYLTNLVSRQPTPRQSTEPRRTQNLSEHRNSTMAQPNPLKNRIEQVHRLASFTHSIVSNEMGRPDQSEETTTTSFPQMTGTESIEPHGLESTQSTTYEAIDIQAFKPIHETQAILDHTHNAQENGPGREHPNNTFIFDQNELEDYHTPHEFDKLFNWPTNLLDQLDPNYTAS